MMLATDICELSVARKHSQSLLGVTGIRKELFLSDYTASHSGGR